MTDYKQLYLQMFRASEKAIELLVDAQRKCEELYINSHDAELIQRESRDESG